MQAPGVALQAGASFALAAALIAYVLGHRPRTAVHRTVLAILGLILVWDAGVLVRLGASDGALRATAFCIQYLGVYALPPFFLYLAMRCARVSVGEERPVATLSALLVPSGLAYLTLLSNPLHGLHVTVPLNEATFGMLREWGGPFFWLSVGWTQVCAQSGIVICVYAAWRAVDPLDRRRLLLVAGAGSAPIFASLAFLFGWISMTITPAALAVSALLAVAAIVRYRLLEFAPIPAREVIAELHEGLLLTDAAGKITDANPAAAELLGRSIESLRGEMIGTLARQLDASGELASLLDDGVKGAVVVRDLETPGGRVIEVSAGWMSGDGRKPICRFLVLNDRTERQRRERLRHRARKFASVGTLAAGLAHEINNPLAYVRASLMELHNIADAVDACRKHLEAKEAERAAQMRELVEDSLEGVARITAIVKSAHRFSHDSSDRRERVDLNAVVKDALQFASLQEGESIALETALAPNLPSLEAAPERLGQVVLNLLINAKQVLEGRSSRRILVETLPHDGGVELRVHDDGPGVPPELRERIFDPFFTTKGPDEGTGLGLAVAYDIVLSCDGVIDVGDSPLGGACFQVRLPAAPKPQSSGVA